LKQNTADLFNVGNAETCSTDGPAVILLRGWPYDIRSYVEVARLGGSKVPSFRALSAPLQLKQLAGKSPLANGHCVPSSTRSRSFGKSAD
jgi:hypothetical protein